MNGGMQARVLPVLLLGALLTPSAFWHIFDGLPLGSLPEFVALILVLPLLASRGLRRMLERVLLRMPRAAVTTITIALLVVVVAKVLLWRAPVEGGFRACYTALADTAPRSGCEKSYENPFLRAGATRMDPRIDFRPDRWNLSFFNSLRFNFYPWVEGNVVRDRLPFAAVWTGELSGAEPRRGEILYSGEGELRISGTATIPLPPSYASVARVGFEIPPGTQRLTLAYRFDDGSRVKDDKPRGPYATVKLLAEDGASPRGAEPLEPVAPPLTFRALGLGVDIALASAFLALGSFYAGLLRVTARGWILLGAAGLLLAFDPTAYLLLREPPLVPRGMPGSLALTGLAVALLLVMIRKPSRPAMLGAYLGIFWFSLFRQDARAAGFHTVLYRAAGDDWLTYESFARTILETWSLEAGEPIFYYQPLFRYVKFVQHLLLGDGDTLVALMFQGLLLWSVFWLVLRLVPRRGLPARMRSVGTACGVLLVLLVTSEPVLRLVYIGASEPLAWFAFPFLFVWLCAPRARRELRGGSLLLGLSFIARMNHAIALGWIFFMSLLRIWRSRFGLAAAMVALFAAVAALPVVHNLYYGGAPSPLPEEHSHERTLPLPPSRWLQVFDNEEVRRLAMRQVGMLFWLTRPHPADAFVTTPQSDLLVSAAFHGVQVAWLVTTWLALRRPRVRSTAAALAIVPLLYLGVHLFYQVADYHPRSIVGAHIAMAAFALLVVRERASGTTALRAVVRREEPELRRV